MPHVSVATAAIWRSWIQPAVWKDRPGAAPAAHGHLARADEEGVAGARRRLLDPQGRVEIGGGDRVARLEPLHALRARNVEQDAARHDVARHLLHPVLLGALARDEVGVVAVVEPAVQE